MVNRRRGPRVWAGALGATLLSWSAVPAASAAAVPLRGPTTTVAADPGEVQEVRTVWTADLGLRQPAAVAYAPEAGELLVAGSGGGGVSVLRMGFDEDLRGSFRLPGVTSPGTLAYDAAGRRLTAIGPGGLVTVSLADLGRAAPPVTVGEVPALRGASAAAFDPIRGTWYVLEADALAVIPSGATAPARRIGLAGLGLGGASGVAFHPGERLVYLLDHEERLLLGVDPASGEPRKTYRLGAIELARPGGMTFAPSSDPTDDPGTLGLFVADRGGPRLLGGVTELSLAGTAALTAPVEAATLVRTVDTSAWKPASPDPSGIVYLPGPGRLEVADSEVDETTGAGYHGANLWQTGLAGDVLDTGTTLAYSKEPTGLGHDPATDTLFVSDDDKKRIFVVRRGPDGRFGTADDPVSSIDTGALGSTDTEDPEFDPSSGDLFFLDGVGTEVYRIDPTNGTFGDGDDVVTHFDVGWLGPKDFEGLASDPSRGTLLVGARATKQIFELTPTGGLVRVIDLSGITGLRFVSGLAWAPAGDGSGAIHYWIADRQQDNGPNPSENDGKLFEVAVGAATNSPPVVTDPGDLTNVVGDAVSLQIQATDPDGDAIASYGATGLPAGLSVDASTGLISGTTSAAGTSSVTISATDARGATGTASFTWTVTDGSGGGTVLTFGPDADAFVSAAQPDRNFGRRAVLRVDASPVRHALLRFSVTGVGTNAIASVKLRIHCMDGSPDGGTLFHVADDSWGETTVTWNNAPPADPGPLASIGAVQAGVWYEIDLSSHVTGDGTYTLRITTASANAAGYDSKEGTAGLAAQLVVALA